MYRPEIREGAKVGVLEAIRDVVVILVALAALAANIALIVLVLKLWGMVKALRDEVSPVLGSLTHTSNTVRETTSLIGELVIEPLARAAGPGQRLSDAGAGAYHHWSRRAAPRRGACTLAGPSGAGLFLGALIGAVLGLLLAPRHGEETRAAVRAHLANARREAEAARAAAEREVLQRFRGDCGAAAGARAGRGVGRGNRIMGQSCGSRMK